MVYLPSLTPSNFSSSDCSTYYKILSVKGIAFQGYTWLGKYNPMARMPTLSGEANGMMMMTMILVGEALDHTRSGKRTDEEKRGGIFTRLLNGENLNFFSG